MIVALSFPFARYARLIAPWGKDWSGCKPGLLLGAAEVSNPPGGDIISLRGVLYLRVAGQQLDATAG